jgi:hypothetical protein
LETVLSLIIGRLGLQVVPPSLSHGIFLDLLSRRDDLVLPTEVVIGRRYIVELSYEITSKSVIDKHLVPFFGDKDLRDIAEDNLLDYIRLKLEKGIAPRTIETALSIVRRVLGFA